ncbi:asparaginase [Paraoerskovia marina]|uniref:asparaginase n=1 Tax=Paraoerskovia marina TaxID=545619 RepID=UPI000492A5FC|nr:asparaginase [Paraoerskovia marina]
MVTAPIARDAVELALVVRGDLVESVHLGHLVVTAPDGSVRTARGDGNVVFWPRSSVKPMQAVAMVRDGLDLPDRLLALAAASHDGAVVHVAGTREILAGTRLHESDLLNTPDLPYDAVQAAIWRGGGHGPARVVQNCSGKHAAMLATCVANGWDTATYLDLDHPLQRSIAATITEFTGDEAGLPVTRDGCGAPLFATTLAGLARALGRVAAAPGTAPGSAEARVARAMSAVPEMVGGPERTNTRLMREIPGVVAKDGADGVFALGLPDGTGVAFKVLDGADRPRAAIAVAALRAVGVDTPGLDTIGESPILGGGLPVGEIVAVLS